MIRIVAENILLFLLPTIVYVAYVYMTREERTGATRVLDDAPLIWLFLAGAIIVVLVLVTFGSRTGGIPALEDCQVAPPSTLLETPLCVPA